jgi:hypothetical protein
MTTNLAFSDWPTIFPNATCATALIDRTVHHADVIAIEGESYRRREGTPTGRPRSSASRSSASPRCSPRTSGARNKNLDVRLHELFVQMNAKDLPSPRVVTYFNAGIFTDAASLTLGSEQIVALTKAAEANWT